MTDQSIGEYSFLYSDNVFDPFILELPKAFGTKNLLIAYELFIDDFIVCGATKLYNSNYSSFSGPKNSEKMCLFTVVYSPTFIV